MARRRKRRGYRRNPIENQALVVGGVLAVGIAAALIFWPKKAAAGAAPNPTTSAAPLTGGRLEFEPGARDYKLQVGGTITVSLPPGREYHVDDFPGESHSGGTVLQGTLNPDSTISFKAIGPGKATALIDTRGETQPMALTIEVLS